MRRWDMEDENIISAEQEAEWFEDSAGDSTWASRIFDEVAYNGCSACGQLYSEELDESWNVVAEPGSIVSLENISIGDFVVRRALGEGRLASVLVVGEDIESHELFGFDGRIRADTLVLRGNDFASMPSESVSCRGHRPTDSTKVIINRAAFTPPSAAPVRNWADSRVGQFDVPTPANCRAASAIHSVVLHETVFPPPFRDSRRVNMQQRNLSVQAFVDGDGTIIQTNDFVDTMIHGSSANSTSIGFEIINYMRPLRRSRLEGQEQPFRAVWFGGDYVPPLRPQLEAVVAMLEFLTDSSKGHGLDIPLVFPDFQNGVFTLRRSLSPRDIHNRRPGPAERGMRSVFGPRRGVLCHASYQSNKTDGIYPVLYCWLRIKGRDGGRRIDASTASRACRELLSSPTRWQRGTRVWRGSTGRSHTLMEMTLDVTRYCPARAPAATKPSTPPVRRPEADEEDRELAETITPSELITRCGFFGPNVVRTEQEVRRALVAAARSEWTQWHTTAGAPRLESEVALFGRLVRYYLAAIQNVRPDTLVAMQATAINSTTNYGSLPTAGTSTAQITAEVRRIRAVLLAGVPGATVPANLATHVGAALRHARQAHLNTGAWRAWSAVWMTACVRGTGIDLGIEAMIQGNHSGRDELIRATAAHWVYTLEAHQRETAGRRGTYHAFDPTQRTPQVGDIIVQDRQARTPGALYTFADIARLAQGRQTHGDIVVEVGATNVVTIGGNVGDSVRKRRYPLDSNQHLVVAADQLYTQESNTGSLAATPQTSTQQLHLRSTARIFALLSPVESCAAVPGQPYRGGILT